MFAKFYEIPSLPFQYIEKPKCCGQTMDGQRENSIHPTNIVCGDMNDDRCLKLLLEPWQLSRVFASEKEGHRFDPRP